MLLSEPACCKASWSPVMSQVTLSRDLDLQRFVFRSLGHRSWSRILKMLRDYAGGLLYCLALYSCAFFGCIFLMGPTIPLLWLRPQWFRWVNDRLISSWLLLPPVRKTFLKHCSWCFYSPNYPLSDFSSRHMIRILYVR